MVDSAARAAADDIRVRQRALTAAAGSVSGGTDPAYAPERERFGAYTHQEIWDRVHQHLDPAALGAVAGCWQANATAVATAFQTFADTTDREFAGWSGRAAEAAQRATREFIAMGHTAYEVCRAVQRLMELNSEAAQAIRAAIASPQQYRPLDDPAAEAVFGGKRRLDHDLSVAAAQADAQDTMTYVYTPTMPASGDAVPRFTPPNGPPGGSDIR
ncbi:hypothetical protein [Nocardia sp. NPDC050710]|uniref:hypothetical protein n=1 Tax=Nocardia sp. NPDC050710 TaxID=3157220 RepID=UPI0033F78AF0